MSVLLIRNTEIENDPVMPLAYAIHERKFKKTHDEFFSVMSDVLPELRSCKNVVIVTDNEEAITASVVKHFPNIPRFLCRNHILQASNFNLQKCKSINLLVNFLFNNV